MHFIVFEAAGEVVDCVVALRLVEPLLTVEGVAIAPPGTEESAPAAQRG
ncbi:hypothetical protein [Streptomyces albidoflavus]